MGCITVLHMEIIPCSDSKSVIVEIPTYPRLRKFILKFWGYDGKEPVEVGMHSMLGQVMDKALMDKNSVKTFREDFTAKIQLKLSKRLSEKSLRRSQVLQFNLEMDKYFKDHLCQWVTAQTNLSLPQSEAIRNFQTKYGLTETDYSYENCYRHVTRWKNKEYERLNAK